MTRGPIRVLSLLPDFDFGGGQVVLLRTLKALAEGEGRHHHLVVAFGRGPLLDSYRQAGIRCEVLGDGSLSGLPAALAQLVKLVRSESIDVLLSLNTPIDRTMAQLCAAATGRPVVVWFMSRAVPLIAFPPPLRRTLAFCKRLVLHPFNFVSVRGLALRVATSAEVADTFARHLGLGTDEFIVIPPGLADESYDRTLDDADRRRLLTELGVAGADPLLINVGMLIPLKGQRELIDMMEAVAQDLPNPHLLLVGDGADRQALAERINDSPVGERIHLLGHRHDVPDLLCLADGLVSASSSEGFGMSVLEAMAASLPVVAVHTPAFLEFVEDGEFLEDGASAVLVADQDGEQLAQGLRRVFATPGMADAMGRRGRELAERHRVTARARSLQAVLEAVARRPGRARRALATARSVIGRRRQSAPLTVGEGPGRGLRLWADRASSDYTRPPERPVQDLLDQRLFPGAVFHDVGANIGFFSLMAARRVGPGGHVVAFEPVAANVEQIMANAELNQFDNIEVVNVALGSESGRGQLLLARHPGGATLDSIGVPQDVVGATDVEIDSLDRLVLNHVSPAPDVIKIDVEGTEGDVLAGMVETLRRHRPLIVIEVDAADTAAAERRARELERRLTDLGYTTRRLDDGYPGIDWAVIHLVAEPT